MLYFAVHIDLTLKNVLNYARMLQLPAGSDGDGWYGLSFAGHFLSLVCIHYELRVYSSSHCNHIHYHVPPLSLMNLVFVHCRFRMKIWNTSDGIFADLLET